MPDGIDDKKKKIGGIKGPGSSQEVERAGSVSDVERVKKAQAVGGTKGVKGAGDRKSTRKMTAAEKDMLMRMISEEADKLFGDGPVSSEQRAVVEDAVKMAVDAAIIEDDDDSDDKGKAKK